MKTKKRKQNKKIERVRINLKRSMWRKIEEIANCQGVEVEEMVPWLFEAGIKCYHELVTPKKAMLWA